MTYSKHLFWDSCMFICWLTRVSARQYDIDNFMSEALKKQRTIYYSTITLAEIRQQHFNGRYGSIQEFFADLGSAFEPIDPNPIILTAAGELRDAKSTNPGDPNGPSRTIGTADAIHLMTCLYVRDTLEVPDIVFHTLDEGKSASWEGKCVPLVGFERWFPEETRTPRVREVCGLDRQLPAYPQTGLAFP